MNKGVMYTGIPSPEELAACPGVPSEERMAKGRVAVIECVQEIPCYPCENACRLGAITIGEQITNLPTLHEEKCTGCGICATVCPMGSIPADAPDTCAGICIKCQACIKICPAGAKYFDNEAFLSHVAMLEQNYTRRSEAEYFI